MLLAGEPDVALEVEAVAGDDHVARGERLAVDVEHGAAFDVLRRPISSSIQNKRLASARRAR